MNLDVKTMPKQNRLAEILKNKGFEKVKPTQNLLDFLGLTVHQFNRIVENKAQPTVQQSLNIKAWLKLESMDEIFC